MIAWLVIGEPHFRAVFLDQAKAMDEAARHHGLIEPLVKEADVREMLLAAFEAGRKSRDEPKRPS